MLSSSPGRGAYSLLGGRPLRGMSPAPDQRTAASSMFEGEADHESVRDDVDIGQQDVGGAGKEGRPEAAEIRIAIFAAQQPVAGQHPFQSRPARPADESLPVRFVTHVVEARRKAPRTRETAYKIRRHMLKGDTAGYISKQPRREQPAAAQAQACIPESAHAGAVDIIRRRRKVTAIEGASGNAECRPRSAAPAEIELDARQTIADLPIVAREDRAAERAEIEAARARRVNEEKVRAAVDTGRTEARCAPVRFGAARPRGEARIEPGPGRRAGSRRVRPNCIAQRGRPRPRRQKCRQSELLQHVANSDPPIPLAQTNRTQHSALCPRGMILQSR